jgi:DNA gyrase/topoisomerase IV subunit A
MVCVNGLKQIKKMPVKNFSMAQRDFTDSTTRNEMCSHIVKMSSNERLWCFTNLGNCYKLDADSIPDGKWKEKGQPLQKVVPEAVEGETVVYFRSVVESLPTGNILFYTRDGMVKKSAWSEYNVVKSVFGAIKLKEGDEVLAIEDEVKGATLLFVTREGMCLNADMSDIPAQGRIASGVKGIQLSDSDVCVSVRQVTEDGEAVLVTDKGYAKRVLVSQLDVMARYRKGVKIIDFNKGDNGTRLVFSSYVKEPYKIVLDIDGDYLTAFSTEVASIENRTHPGKPLVKGKHEIKEVLIYRDSQNIS